MRTDGKAIVRAIYDALSEHDLDALDGYIAQEVTIHGMEAQGLAALKAEMRNYYAGVPDFRVEVKQIIAAGDRVAAWITCDGTHTAELWGIPATGRTLALPEMDLCRIEDHKVVEYWVLSDEAAFMTQLGLAGEPQPAG
jgi:steroid delta-isomerase-like uncharacterized protein